MIHKIFAIYDTAAKAFLPPFFMPEKGMAVRVFSDCINDPNHQFGKHPADYTLQQIGTFSDQDGSLVPQSPELVALGLALVVRPKADPAQLSIIPAEDAQPGDRESVQ